LIVLLDRKEKGGGEELFLAPKSPLWSCDLSPGLKRSLLHILHKKHLVSGRSSTSLKLREKEKGETRTVWSRGGKKPRKPHGDLPRGRGENSYSRRWELVFLIRQK